MHFVIVGRRFIFKLHHSCQDFSLNERCFHVMFAHDQCVISTQWKETAVCAADVNASSGVLTDISHLGNVANQSRTKSYTAVCRLFFPPVSLQTG